MRQSILNQSLIQMAKQDDHIYTRENFLRLLKKNFGNYRQEGGTIKFDIDNKNVADAIAMDQGQLSRTLSPSNTSYKRAVERVLMYEDAIAYRKLKKFQKIYFGYFVPLLILGLLFWYNPFQSVIKDSAVDSSNNIPGMYCSPSPKLDDIIDASGRATLHRLKWETILLNERVKKRGSAITKRDSIQVAVEMQTAVEEALREEREYLKKLNFRFPSGTPYMDLVESTMSSHIDSIFKIKKDEIIYIKDADQLPSQATRFDLALMESLAYILSSDYTYTEVAEKIGGIVDKEQQYITYGVKKLAEPEMKSK